MIWLAVDEDGTEYIYFDRPSRYSGCWYVKNNCDMVRLHDGKIEMILGRKITWKDYPVELKEDEMEKNHKKRLLEDSNDFILLKYIDNDDNVSDCIVRKSNIESVYPYKGDKNRVNLKDGSRIFVKDNVKRILNEIKIGFLR